MAKNKHTKAEESPVTVASPTSKFQAAAFAVGSSAAVTTKKKMERNEIQQQQQQQLQSFDTTTGTATSTKKLTTSTNTNNYTPTTKITLRRRSAPHLGQQDLVSPKSKFKAAAFAIQSSNANKQGEEEEDHGNEEQKTGSNDDDDDDVDNYAKLAYAAKIAALTAQKARAARLTKNERLFTKMVISTTSWDVWSPPSMNSVSGKMIPRFINRHKHRRKISLEIHKVTQIVNSHLEEGKGEKKDNYYHEAVLRMLVPETKELSRKYKMDTVKKMRTKERSSAISSDSIRHINDIMDGLEEDDASIVSSSTRSMGSSASAAAALEKSHYYQIADHGGNVYEGWKPKYSIPMYSLFIQNTHKRSKHSKTVQFLISIQDFKMERELVFDTHDDAQLFLRQIEKEKRHENERREERLQSALADANITLPKFETITLLFEIVSAYDIPIGDYTTSDPYVIACLGHQELHRTKVLPSTLNPIWTLKTGSLFLLTVESKQFFIEEGMKFIMKDHDKLGKHDTLGIVKVEPKVFYKATDSERMEFKLQPPHGSKEHEVPGILVIRCRRATQYDQQFMAEYEKNAASTSKFGVMTPFNMVTGVIPGVSGETSMAKGVSAYAAPVATTNVFKTLTTKVKKKEKGTDTILYKVRPGPDPKLPPEDTEWLTNIEIQKAVLETSHEWVDMGEGDLGKIYVEILGCDDLPNMDSGAFYGNKTDTFITCVYEDVYGRTDVIDDCLAPRWLPWSNRAFIFSMTHPSSSLNIGVFDYDAGADQIASHDLIGRVSVDLTNFRSATEYVLRYDIFPSARIIQGRAESQGKIMIRLRMDLYDERKLVMASLTPPKAIYVNTTNRKDFRVIQETCFGSIDEDRYNTDTLRSYIGEITELQHCYFYIEDALMTLLLWRGHCEVTLPSFLRGNGNGDNSGDGDEGGRKGGWKIKVPLHSFTAFVISIFLVEHPHLYPSFFFVSVAWFLLAIMGWRRNLQNVWCHCHSYLAMLKMLGLGDDFARPQKIKPFENFGPAKKEMEQWVKRIEDSEARAARNAERALELDAERQKELAEIGEADTEIGTKFADGGLVFDPIRAALYPIQQMLGSLVMYVRSAKNIIMWQEAYFSFWISTGSLMLAILCLFVPWFWCIKWGSRIFAWTIFGPWMKLLDIYYFSLIKPESDEERQFREQAEKLRDKLATTNAVKEARLLRENAAKQRVLQKYMFGRYAVEIPIFKRDRYADIPLAESFATPYKEKDFSLAELAMQEAGYRTIRVPGQTLEGDMIPYVKGDNFTLAPTGRPAAHPEKLSKNAPGATAFGTTASSIVGAVVVAILITYFGTPMLATVVSEGSTWMKSM